MAELTEQDREELAFAFGVRGITPQSAAVVERIVARHVAQAREADGTVVARRLEAFKGDEVVGAWHIFAWSSADEQWARDCAKAWHPSADTRLIVTIEKEQD